MNRQLLNSRWITLLQGLRYRGNRASPSPLTASLYDGTSAGISLREHIQPPRSSHPSPGGTGTPRDRFIAMTSPKHGEPFPEIYFDATLVSNGLYAYWIVTAIYRTEDQEQADYTFKIDYETLSLTYIDEKCSIKGYLYTTTNPTDRKAGRRTFKEKKSERIFFSLRESPPANRA